VPGVAALIDLHHLGRERVIASYLLAGEEPALVDCGPASCLEALRDGLRKHGLAVSGLRHLLLTHIHLDHAGAAGTLVREHPGLRVHVSEIGAPHLVDPTRLERSARRLYGDEFDRLWGELAPVPQENVAVAGGRVLGLEVFPTPGHASHHISYLGEDGTCFSGDATGVRIPPSGFLAPVSPPPDVDLEAWETTLDAIAARRPVRLCLPHFGVVDEPESHVEQMRAGLRTWAARVEAGMDEEEWVRVAEEEIAAQADAETAAVFRQAGPLWQSYAGLRRYWDKRRETAAA
jgi:glyoxylase-like metal-dependent hydrolase (beta-lactamase superfamily II)